MFAFDYKTLLKPCYNTNASDTPTKKGSWEMIEYRKLFAFVYRHHFNEVYVGCSEKVTKFLQDLMYYYSISSKIIRSN